MGPQSSSCFRSGKHCVALLMAVAAGLAAGGCATLGEPAPLVAGGPGHGVPAVVWADGPAWFPESMTVTGMAHPVEESYLRPEEPAQFGMIEESSSDAPSIWPLEHPARYVSRGYAFLPGSRRSVGGRLHAGMDIIAPEGTSVVAAGGGRVAFCGTENGYGFLVKIVHMNEVETWYAHLSAFSVNEGDYVSIGQEIGKVGHTGRATTSHLHYEVHEHGRAVNPQPFLP